MELPTLGINCCVSGCNLLEFLPLKCECGKLFCTDHFMEHTLTCEAFKETNKTKLKNTSKTTYRCNFDDCSDISLFQFPCKKCGQHYCIRHRHHKTCEISEEELELERKRWALPIEQYNIAKEKLDIHLTKNAMKMQPDSKKSKMSNKIQLMRLKGKAIGHKEIPTEDRCYFLVHKPIGTNTKLVLKEKSDAPCGTSESTDNKQKIESVPVFISKTWSVGKSIDSISGLCKIVNNNNKVNESKLRLFRISDGLIISSVMSMKVSNILENNTIRDGESLILEYVDSEISTAGDCYLQDYALYSE